MISSLRDVTHLLLEHEVELGDHVFAQHDGQKFVVGDVLNHGDDNVSSFLLTFVNESKQLMRPFRHHKFERFVNKNFAWKRISSSQCGLITYNWVAIRLCSRAHSVCMHVKINCSFTRISPVDKQFSFKQNKQKRVMGGFKILKSGTAIKAEFVAIFGSMRAALIGNVRLGWKQIHQSKGSQHWIHSQMAAITRTQRPFFSHPQIYRLNRCFRSNWKEKKIR